MTDVALVSTKWVDRPHWEASLPLLAHGEQQRGQPCARWRPVHAREELPLGPPSAPEWPPSPPELKAAQRQFFVLLYRLLIGKDTAPGCPRCCSPWARSGSDASQCGRSTHLVDTSATSVTRRQ